jgi:hypothetical protein
MLYFSIIRCLTRNDKEKRRNMKIKRIISINLVFCFVSAFLAVQNVLAEDYVNKNFPANDILIKTLSMGPYGYHDVKYIGKYKEGDTYYLCFRTKEKNLVIKSLVKLDSDVWIFERMVLQK